MCRPATVESCFEPGAGQEPFAYVFDFSGEIQSDRPDQVSTSSDYIALADPSPRSKSRRLSMSLALSASRLRSAKSRRMCAYSTRSMNARRRVRMMRRKILNLTGFWAHGGMRRYVCSPLSKSKHRLQRDPPETDPSATIIQPQPRHPTDINGLWTLRRLWKYVGTILSCDVLSHSLYSRHGLYGCSSHIRVQQTAYEGAVSTLCCPVVMRVG